MPQFPLTRINPDPVPQDAANVASRIGLTNAVLFYGNSLYVVDGGTPLDDVGENTPVVPGKISRYERYPPYTYIGESTLMCEIPYFGGLSLPQAKSCAMPVKFDHVLCSLQVHIAWNELEPLLAIALEGIVLHSASECMPTPTRSNSCHHLRVVHLHRGP